MRPVPDYVQLAKNKYEEDHSITDISLQECVDFVVDNAFFGDEITYPIVEPLKKQLMISLRKICLKPN